MIKELENFFINFIIGGSAAVISKTIIAPVERTKFILQNQDSAWQIITGEAEGYKGALDVIRRLPKEQGYLSFWRGNGTNLIRYFPSQALNFSFYDSYKHLFYSLVTNETYGKILMCKLLAGGLAGACSSFIIFPLDFCQTRLTVDIGNASASDGPDKCKMQREFVGLSNCIHKIYQRDGILGLYNGIHMSILGLAVYRAFYFSFFDLAKSFYSNAPLNTSESLPKIPVLMSFLMAQVVTSVAGFIAYPLDTVSRRMMLDSGRPDHLRKCKTTIMAFKGIYRKRGIYGFYKGGLTNIVRCTAGALVLVLYDEFLYYTKWKEKI